jgi:hypothetical protein
LRVEVARAAVRASEQFSFANAIRIQLIVNCVCVVVVAGSGGVEAGAIVTSCGGRIVTCININAARINTTTVIECCFAIEIAGIIVITSIQPITGGAIIPAYNR